MKLKASKDLRLAQAPSEALWSTLVFSSLSFYLPSYELLVLQCLSPSNLLYIFSSQDSPSITPYFIYYANPGCRGPATGSSATHTDVRLLQLQEFLSW
jgi:hypothetical protein